MPEAQWGPAERGRGAQRPGVSSWRRGPNYSSRLSGFTHYPLVLLADWPDLRRNNIHQIQTENHGDPDRGKGHRDRDRAGPGATDHGFREEGKGPCPRGGPGWAA